MKASDAMRSNANLILWGICFCISLSPVYCQDNPRKILTSPGNVENRIYTSLENALRNVWQVVHLDLSGQGLEEIPSDISKLENLKRLDLSKNALLLEAVEKADVKLFIKQLDVQDSASIQACVDDMTVEKHSEHRLSRIKAEAKIVES